ncbi:MAG: PorT family protein [Candidatus Zixiibacteriota bacterium]|nr:MAG: PorT family protein [candidate division Zixibacteria bacterium]
MKQLTCVTLMSFLIAAAAAAPTQAGSNVQVGPIFALNESRFFGEDVDVALGDHVKFPLKTTTGGAFVRYNLSRKFSVVPQLIYAKRGDRFFHNEASNDTLSTYTFIVRLNYIDIPVLLRFTPPLHKNLNPYIIAGPSIALAVSGDVEFRLAQTSDGETITEGYTLDRLDIYNVADIQVGMVVGVGLEIQIGRYGFLVEVRYSGHLNNAFSDVSGYDESPEGQEVLAHSDGEAFQLRNGAGSLMFSLSYALGI